MADEAKEAFKKVGLGAENNAYDIIAKLDPEYFEKLKGLYVDGTFGREGALPRKTKELIMVGICCALLRPRGIRLHSERALTLGATPKEVMEAMEVAAIPGGMPGLWARRRNAPRDSQGERHRVQIINGTFCLFSTFEPNPQRQLRSKKCFIPVLALSEGGGNRQPWATYDHGKEHSPERV